MTALLCESIERQGHARAGNHSDDDGDGDGDGGDNSDTQQEQRHVGA